MFRLLSTASILALFVVSATPAYAVCHLSRIKGVALPLDSSGKRTLKAIEKSVGKTRKAAKRNGRDLELINCHAAMFKINMIQGLDWIKAASTAGKFKSKGYYALAAGNLGKAVKNARNVFNMYFEDKNPRYEFVWKYIKISYERIANAYRKEGYDLARISYKKVKQKYRDLIKLIAP